MNCIITFVIGLIIGTFLGVTLICLLKVNKED